MNNIYDFIRNKGFDSNKDYEFTEMERAIDVYAAELLCIDVEAFRKETEAFDNLSVQLERAEDDLSLNKYLKQFMDQIRLDVPWEGSFDVFMSDKSKRLYFE